MKVAIITSDRNSASVNIRNNLLKNFDFRKDGQIYFFKDDSSSFELHSLQDEMLYADDMDKQIGADLFMFASTHKSGANIDTFAVHSIGNWGAADLGGKERTLCPSPASVLKSAFQILCGNKFGLETIQEATHHGPFISKPAMFIEIGSSEQMYNDEEAGKIIASTIIQSVKESKASPSVKSAVGIGGLHHTPNFRKIMLNTDISVAHVCPKYALQYLDEEMLAEAISKCTPKASLIIADWKGLGEFKEKVKSVCSSTGLELLKTSQY